MKGEGRGPRLTRRTVCKAWESLGREPERWMRAEKDRDGSEGASASIQARNRRAQRGEALNRCPGCVKAPRHAIATDGARWASRRMRCPTSSSVGIDRLDSGGLAGRVPEMYVRLRERLAGAPVSGEVGKRLVEGDIAGRRHGNLWIGKDGAHTRRERLDINRSHGQPLLFLFLYPVWCQGSGGAAREHAPTVACPRPIVQQERGFMGKK